MEHPRDIKLLAIAGEAGARRSARLLLSVLEGAPGVRACLLEADRAPLPALLESAAEGGCTHAVALLTQRALASGWGSGVGPYAAAPVGPREDWLAPVLARSERLILDLDEPGWDGYNKKNGVLLLTYSERKDRADLTAKHTRLCAAGVQFEAVAAGGIGRVRLAPDSGFGVYDALCAMACGLALGLAPGETARAVSRSASGPPRGLRA